MSFRFNRLLLCADDKRRWSLTKTRSCADQIHVRFVDGMHLSWTDRLVDRLRVCCRAIFVEYSLEPEGSRRVLVILRTWVCHASVWCIGIPRNWTRDEQRDRARKGYFILVVSISWEQWTIVKVFRCSTLSLSLSVSSETTRARKQVVRAEKATRRKQETMPCVNDVEWGLAFIRLIDWLWDYEWNSDWVRCRFCCFRREENRR